MTESEHGPRSSHFRGGGTVLSGWDFGCGFAFLSPSASSVCTDWPLVSDAAGRRLPICPELAKQGDDLLRPAWGREERVQVCESSPSGRSGSRKCLKRQAESREKMGDQALWMECPWEA